MSNTQIASVLEYAFTFTVDLKKTFFIHALFLTQSIADSTYFGKYDIYVGDDSDYTKNTICTDSEAGANPFLAEGSDEETF